ncbi:ABC transporter ATP-binding protein [Facklamia languida]|uniref:ABC transporter domain-containing protein n=1 Tax=Facklamia languida CCUG 37842 TaxID=883113 RepID=H3NIF0_9LACT|nr:ABC transporter ATP-binding protein [Facklamia languida]EHR37460.1 hypothetical protein HMPREF9708_00639 [Facklamia languida CCUG 37842]
MGKIYFDSIVKNFGNVNVIPDLSLEIPDGSFSVLLGPSGCGKTTLLRMLAGFEKVTSGTIKLDDVDITNKPANKRDVAMVFQNYALYPTMTVRNNIEYGLKNIGMKKSERDDLVQTVSKIVELEDLLNRKPGELSGGQRQRVALARAIVKKPKVFLMDEPLSNLDAKLRAEMRYQIDKIHKTLGTTFIYVTHDQAEAMALADQLVLMSHGKIMQVGHPMKVYDHPNNTFVANFLGIPPMNLIKIHNDLVIGFRPEDVQINSSQLNDGLSIDSLRVIHKEMLGAVTNYLLEINKDTRVYLSTANRNIETDDIIDIFIPNSKVKYFDANNIFNPQMQHPENIRSLIKEGKTVVG